MTTLTGKKYFEIELDEILRALGITEVSIFEKNIVVSIEGRNSTISTFRKDEWQRTSKALERLLISDDREGVESTR